MNSIFMKNYQTAPRLSVNHNPFLSLLFGVATPLGSICVAAKLGYNQG